MQKVIDVKKMFAEFKSIFVSENILEENEQHANIVTASTMLNIFWICLISWALTFFNVFKVGTTIMNAIFIRCIILLVIPAVVCRIVKGKGKILKYLLFICFTFMLAIADATLKYNVTLIMVLPSILAARYYNKKFTITVSVITTIVFIISTYMCVNLGQQDLNSYNLVIPEGTTITINTTLRDAISKINVNETQRLKNIFIHFFIPKILVFNIIAFACAQISQSGKKMIEKQKEISQNNARIKTELNLANAIQKNVLPSVFPPFPNHKEFDIYASMIPAKEVGGDFYDMFLIDENHLAICVGDVSGKGVPASLFMMISKILIKNVSSIDKEVDIAFNRINNMLCDGNKLELFVTCWLGVLDLKNGKLEFANAGHNPPLLYSNKTGTFEYLRSKPNMVLAGMENILYRKNEIQIEPGARLFLYTDGAIEATNDKNDLYGEEKLKKYLNNNLHLSVKDTINGVKEDIDKFVGNAEQFDDITMLELIYNGNYTQKEFVADKNVLPNVFEFVNKELKKNNCDEKSIMQINLAVEEIFINIAKYAYNGKVGKCSLTMQFRNNDEVIIFFEDNGIPFNPLEKGDPDVTLSAKERNIGGLGIYITKQIMDNATYSYEDSKNILTIIKKFERAI